MLPNCNARDANQLDKDCSRMENPKATRGAEERRWLKVTYLTGCEY
jgi:hypothetical protein